MTTKKIRASNVPGFGSRLKAIRNERNLTLDSLAEQMGVSKSMLSHLENDYASPTLKMAIELAHALGCQIGDLVPE